jgi:lambda family phage tail tape measure protein
MADLTYRVEVTTAQAERNLAKLQSSVSSINDTFAGLKQALAGIAIGQFITNSLNLAARLDTLGKATGIAVENLRGFQLAVSQAGGNSDQASDAVSDLVKNIGDAANGSSELVSAFRTAGVSLNDLRTLSEQDILKKTIDGIAKIGDSSTQSSVKAKIFGEALKNVNINSVAANFGSLSAESGKYAAAANAAREAQLKMNQAIDKLQESVVIALTPINNFIASIDPQAITAFANTIINLAKVFVGLYVIEKITTVVSAFGLAATATTGKLGNLATALGKTESARAYTQGLNRIKRELSELPSAFDRAFNPERFRGKDVGFKMIGNAFSMMGLGLARMLPLIGQVITGIVILDGVVAGLTGKDLAGWFNSAAAGLEKLVSDKFPKLAEQLNKIGEKLGMAPSPGQQAAADKAAADHLANLKEIEAENEKVRKAIIRGQEALAKIGQAYAKNSLAAKQDLEITGEALSIKGMQLVQERMMIGLNEDQVEMRRTMLGLDDEMFAKQADIARQIEKLKVDRANLAKGQEDESKILSGQIGILQNQSKEVGTLYGRHKSGISEQLKLLQDAKKAEENRLFVREQIVKSLQTEAAQQQNLNDTMRDINQRMTDIKFGVSLTGLSPLRKQIAQINEDARKAAQEAGNAFAATFEDNGFLTPEEAQALSNGLAQIAQGYKNIANEQIKSLGVSDQYLSGNLDSLRAWREEFRVGTKDAFDKFKDDANDAGKQAADSFSTFTSGMEDAFVQFVQTGKLSFKSLANSIIADLIRIAVRRAIVAAIGGPLGSLFGMANGGPVMGATPIIVGERGPELFVPQTAGKIISNSALKGSGSAPSSMGGGQTVVNYNIQAVDASSFRSLVAKDPSFIYAVTEQGRRSQPTRSR